MYQDERRSILSLLSLSIDSAHIASLIDLIEDKEKKSILSDDLSQFVIDQN